MFLLLLLTPGMCTRLQRRIALVYRVIDCQFLQHALLNRHPLFHRCGSVVSRHSIEKLAASEGGDWRAADSSL